MGWPFSLCIVAVLTVPQWPLARALRTKSIDAVKLLNSIGKAKEIPVTDAIIFELLEHTGIEPRGETLEEISAIMKAATVFVENNDWYFTQPAYSRTESVLIGNHVILDGPTLYNILKSLNKMEAEGKSEKSIKEKIAYYYQRYCCADIRL